MTKKAVKFLWSFIWMTKFGIYVHKTFTRCNHSPALFPDPWKHCPDSKRTHAITLWSGLRYIIVPHLAERSWAKCNSDKNMASDHIINIIQLSGMLFCKRISREHIMGVREWTVKMGIHFITCNPGPYCHKYMCFLTSVLRRMCEHFILHCIIVLYLFKGRICRPLLKCRKTNDKKTLEV